MVAVTAALVALATVYQSTVALAVPCPAVTDPAAAGETVHCIVQLGGKEETEKFVCPLLHTFPPPEIVGDGMVLILIVVAAEGQLF